MESLSWIVNKQYLYTIMGETVMGADRGDYIHTLKSGASKRPFVLEGT